MEAATPLRPPSVRTVGADRVAVDGLIVEDGTVVRLVRGREDAREDPVELLLDAVEIGARVLEREQTGANAEFVKTEFEKAARELQSDFGERARAVTEAMAQELERRFSDGSTEAVQHRVREAVDEVMAKSREELARQFSADDGRNPLAAFQKSALTLIRQSADQQDTNLRAVHAKMGELEKELQRLRDQEQKQLELAEERERGTAKGRDYEESVCEALDAIASVQGDDCDGVDLAAVAETVERALGAMDEVRSVKQKLTGAQTSIRAADELLEKMAGSVRGHLARIDELLAGAD